MSKVTKGAVYLYVAPILKDISIPLSRKDWQEEINDTNSAVLRAEKYTVRRLIEYISDHKPFDLPSPNSIKRTPSLSWKWGESYLSVSHSEGVAAVALSTSPLGLDIQKVRKVAAGLEQRILNEDELSEFRSIDTDTDKNLFLLQVFTKKEAIFKLSDEEVFMPRKFSYKNFLTYTSIYKEGDSQYFYSIAAKDVEKIEARFFLVSEKELT